MTLGMSAATANSILDTTYATVYGKLHTADPGASGTTAAAAGDTTRKQIPMAAASGGSKAMSGTNPVWTNGGTSESLSHLTLWTAASAGSFLASLALTTAQSWASTNTFTLTSLTITLAPIAA